MSPTRRSVIGSTSAALLGGLAGCIGGGSGSNGGNETYEVGAGDYQTTVDAPALPFVEW